LDGTKSTLYILQVSLVLVVAYSAWRHDRQERPLALLCGYELLIVDFGMMGLRALWFRLHQHSTLLRFGLGWPIDVLFVSFFGALWATAFRYHRDRWPARLWLRAAGLALGLLVVVCVHAVQRVYLRLGPWDIGVRWVALNLSCLVCSVLAGWHLAQVFRKKDVTPAHLVLGLFVIISIIQFLMALKPGDWDMSLFLLATLLLRSLSLAVYGVRLAGLAFRQKTGPA